MLLTESGNTEQWKNLVSEAADRAGTRLDEELESYLVFTLIRYLRRPDMAQQALALEFLQAFEMQAHVRSETLREVGDQCLLVSGLFPKRAERRRVQISYYVDLGRAAYLNLAEMMAQLNDLYLHLAEGFVRVMDTLQAMRLMTDPQEISLFQALELYHKTHSKMARQILENANLGMITLQDVENQQVH